MPPRFGGRSRFAHLAAHSPMARRAFHRQQIPRTHEIRHASISLVCQLTRTSPTLDSTEVWRAINTTHNRIAFTSISAHRRSPGRPGRPVPISVPPPTTGKDCHGIARNHHCGTPFQLAHPRGCHETRRTEPESPIWLRGRNRLNIWVHSVDSAEEARCVTADDNRSVLSYQWTDDPRWLLYIQDDNGDPRQLRQSSNPNRSPTRELAPLQQGLSE